MSNAAIVPSPIGTPKSVRNYEKEPDREYVGDPWARQPGESSKAFKCFCIYLSIDPPERTQVEAFRRYCAEVGAVSAGNGWPRKHRWSERSALFDSFVDAKQIAAHKRQLIRSATKHAEQMAALQEISMLPVTELRERLREQGGQLSIIADLDDVSLLKLSQAMGKELPAYQEAERKALGSTEEIVVQQKDLKEKGQKVLRMLRDKTTRVLLERISIEGNVEELPADAITDRPGV